MTSISSTSVGSVMEQHRLPPSMIERVTLIMDCFDRPHTRRALEHVAQKTGLPRSTAYRILEQLVRLRWLDRTETGYKLGLRSLGLGGREIGRGALRAAAAPKLLELALRTDLVVHLAVLDGTEVYYLDKVGGRAAFDVPTSVAGRAPAHCTAVGKAMLACMTPEQVDVEYRGGLERRTARSIESIFVLHRQLSQIRCGTGLATERGECFAGFGCVGMVVHGPDGPVGAVSLTAAAYGSFERVVPLLVKAVRAVSDDLCKYQGPNEPDQLVPSPVAS
ncbi:IclR family transcriptional regulator [Nocardia cerradoensis]|uniref:Putative HTH-type transcriptional regulator RhmR n=1 Tax=Nocardia cerradoensis TaxID=85688 RepID=A0A231GUZ1_9NOCA|nr:IclR family transcriptional regulator [Nocardia cerradoensis]NKY43624.1 IclR family transcriptional regulator [Nocardia cerradoensis]OXR40447.1 putative HTH-type transcriptional regulator RhmR [Nocardia cerradoensis]